MLKQSPMKHMGAYLESRDKQHAYQRTIIVNASNSWIAQELSINYLHTLKPRMPKLRA
jgi:hypothetical protein